jgi:hypothetical protein
LKSFVTSFAILIIIIEGIGHMSGSVPADLDKPRAKTKLETVMLIAQILTPVVIATLPVWGSTVGNWNSSRNSIELERLKAWSQFRSKEEETRQKVLDAAIAILKSPVDKDHPEISKEAKSWAVEVVKRYKPLDYSDTIPQTWPIAISPAQGQSRNPKDPPKGEPH